MDGPSNVTHLLLAWKGGDRGALDELTPLVYRQLCRIAGNTLHRFQPGASLDVNALVHEAYLRLVDIDRVDWQDRAHFFGIAARLMRQVLLNRVEAQHAAKRGGGGVLLTLGAAEKKAARENHTLNALEAALTQMERIDPQQCRIVELRYFGGLTVEETAAQLGLSPATVKREWTAARAWLRRELSHA